MTRLLVSAAVLVALALASAACSSSSLPTAPPVVSVAPTTPSHTGSRYEPWPSTYALQGEIDAYLSNAHAWSDVWVRSYTDDQFVALGENGCKYGAALNSEGAAESLVKFDGIPLGDAQVVVTDARDTRVCVP